MCKVSRSPSPDITIYIVTNLVFRHNPVNGLKVYWEKNCTSNVEDIKFFEVGFLVDFIMATHEFSIFLPWSLPWKSTFFTSNFGIPPVITTTFILPIWNFPLISSTGWVQSCSWKANKGEISSIKERGLCKDIWYCNNIRFEIITVTRERKGIVRH